MRSLLLPSCHSSSIAYVSTTRCSFFQTTTTITTSVNSISSIRRSLRIRLSSDEQLSSSNNTQDRVTQTSIGTDDASVPPPPAAAAAAASDSIQKDLKKVVNKTAATFAPRASTASKNPAVPGTTLYSIFEIQGYVSMFLGGLLSFNLVFPSNEPDLWRLMGMWSIWMFTIPSLRARDCSTKEKEALNYLFLLIPLLNVIIPFFWKSFAVVWSADTVAFFVMYAWKLGWLEKSE
ncbi:protein RESISTANCE TO PHYTOPHTHORA 1, chloroplastic [Silene latifolia]